MKEEAMRSAREVFSDWAGDYHADGMEKHHAPAVMEALASLPESEGDFLEIGVGNGYAIATVARGAYAAGRCHGLDIVSGMVDRAREKIGGLANVSLECADFMDWEPPEQRRYELIFSMEVFYYFSDMQRALERAAGLLAPGGRLMVLVNHFAEHLASHAWSEQLRTPMTLWSAEEFRRGFSAAGLQDVEQSYLDAASTEAEGSPGTLATVGRRP
jgi:SAM-dependent methyltransferase